MLTLLDEMSCFVVSVVRRLSPQEGFLWGIFHSSFMREYSSIVVKNGNLLNGMHHVSLFSKHLCRPDIFNCRHMIKRKKQSCVILGLFWWKTTDMNRNEHRCFIHENVCMYVFRAWCVITHKVIIPNSTHARLSLFASGQHKCLETSYDVMK